MKAFVRCEDIWKIYNEGKPQEVVALREISLSINKGTIVSLIGPSGSGKTTLLGIMGTLIRPTKGRLYIKEHDVTAFSDIGLSRLRAEVIGYVFQEFNLLPRLSAWRNVSYPLVPKGLSLREMKDRAIRLLERIGLGERVEHFPEELSGGEQQRVAIARALINDPEMVLLDEPTSNIDSETAELIISLLQELRRDGKTLILSTHDENLTNYSDMVVRLKRGFLQENDI